MHRRTSASQGVHSLVVAQAIIPSLNEAAQLHIYSQRQALEYISKRIKNGQNRPAAD